MVALFSPRLSSSFGWLSEDPISHQHEDLIDLHSPDSAQTKNGSSFNDRSIYGTDGNAKGNTMVKKIDHNASERDRRKRINDLYSTLRFLLPHEDRSKKLSIPITVSRVLDYIPVLQQEVERLVKKKETLTKTASLHVNSNNVEEKCYSTSQVVVSATPICDGEIVFHVSMPKVEQRATISEAIERSEREGFIAMNASCFESFDGRVFYNLHLKAQGSEVTMDADVLKKIVCPFYF